MPFVNFHKTHRISKALLKLLIFKAALVAAAACAVGGAEGGAGGASESAASAASAAAKTTYFFCEWRGVPWQNKNRPSNRSFDRVFSYEKSPDGFQASFKEADGLQPAKEKQGVLYRDIPEEGSGGGLQKEIYRFHPETQTLVRSFVSYLTEEDYETRLKEEKANPYIIPCSKEPLEIWEDPEARAPFKRICGFDKSEWRCREISRLKYFWFRMTLEILRALAV